MVIRQGGNRGEQGQSRGKEKGKEKVESLLQVSGSVPAWGEEQSHASSQSHEKGTLAVC